MKLALNETEIKTACSNFLETLGINTEGQNISVRLIAGRKSNGHSAEIEVTKGIAITENLPVTAQVVEEHKMQGDLTSDIHLSDNTTDSVEPNSLFEDENNG